MASSSAPTEPGRSFQLFQQYLKTLERRGFLLAVASRNEHRDVQEVFEKHPGMILRPKDIAAWRVNWAPKSQNLRELAGELRLGLDSLVFVDDDPVMQDGGDEPCRWRARRAASERSIGLLRNTCVDCGCSMPPTAPRSMLRARK